MQTPTLETRSLILRPMEVADAPALFQHFSNWNVIQYLSKGVPWPYTEQDAHDYTSENALPAVERGEALIWAITPKTGPDSAQLVGMIEYRLQPSPLGNRGFWLSEKYQGQGWMTEAIEATQDYVFFDYGLNELILSNAVSNPASRHLKERYGADYLETVTLEHHNGDCRSEKWRITRDHWARIRGSPAP